VCKLSDINNSMQQTIKFSLWCVGVCSRWWSPSCDIWSIQRSAATHNWRGYTFYHPVGPAANYLRYSKPAAQCANYHWQQRSVITYFLEMVFSFAAFYTCDSPSFVLSYAAVFSQTVKIISNIMRHIHGHRPNVLPSRNGLFYNFQRTHEINIFCIVAKLC